jgi:hypothetical protein
MYFRRRWNLLRIRLARPFEEAGGKPFALYTLHMQPEASIDVFGSYYANQLTLVRQIAQSLPITHELYVKGHPDDIDGKALQYYEELRRISAVRLIHPNIDSRELLRKAAVVITISGTIAFEAGLMQVPAITFAQNFFNVLPGVIYCDSPKRLPGLLTKIFAERDDAKKDGTPEILGFLARLHASTFPGQIDGYMRPFSRMDLRNLLIAYNTIIELRCVRATVIDCKA